MIKYFHFRFFVFKFFYSPSFSLFSTFFLTAFVNTFNFTFCSFDSLEFSTIIEAEQFTVQLRSSGESWHSETPLRLEVVKTPLYYPFPGNYMKVYGVYIFNTKATVTTLYGQSSPFFFKTLEISPEQVTLVVENAILTNGVIESSSFSSRLVIYPKNIVYINNKGLISI